MYEKDVEIVEGNWTQRTITNLPQYVQYVGLDAVTIRSKDSKPFFFLFIDIDSKDEEVLRHAINLCREKRLTIYWYETCKGHHIISPCLLGIRNWIGILMRLKRLQDSSGDTIRWTPRHCDGKLLFYHSFNTGHKQHQESYDLHYHIREKFGVKFDIRIDNMVSSSLEWNVYNQLRLKKIRHT